ncbi:hypothetical protein MRX96_055939 [Rhipicephalus microplus]
MWSSLTELAESSHDSSKAEAIRGILSEKEVVYGKAILMRDALGPLSEAQKTLESGKFLMPSFDHLVNVKLQQIVGELSAVIGFFKRFAAVAVAVALLQPAPVRCDLDLAEYWPDKCQTKAQEGHTAGLCVPAAWCPSLEGAARRDDLPSSCPRPRRLAAEMLPDRRRCETGTVQT